MNVSRCGDRAQARDAPRRSWRGTASAASLGTTTSKPAATLRSCSRPEAECLQRINRYVRNDCKIDLAAAFRVKDANAISASDGSNSVVVNRRNTAAERVKRRAGIGNAIVYWRNVWHVRGTNSEFFCPCLTQDIMTAAPTLEATRTGPSTGHSPGIQRHHRTDNWRKPGSLLCRGGQAAFIGVGNRQGASF